MPERPPIQLICFDLGGVLIRICQSWAEVFRAAGLDVRGEINSDPSGANGRKDLSRLHQTGQISCAEFFKEMSIASAGRYSPNEIERIHDAWLLGEYTGVDEVIDRIHRAGVMTAALSNTNLAHWKRMPEFPAFVRLQKPLASHEMGLVKPDAAMYRAAERLLGVEGSRILFFDDRSDNISAASAVGWNAAQIDHAGDTAKQIEAALIEHRVAI